MYYIYFLKNLNGEVKYVGQTQNLDIRKREHKRNKPQHTFEIGEEIDIPERAKEKEIFYIEKFDTFKNGWNKSTGGEGFDNYERKGIGGVKKGNIPWNKGMKNCFSKETVEKMSNSRKGRVFNRKIDDDQIRSIRKLYNEKPNLQNVGMIMRNGKKMSYVQAFCKEYAEQYNLTPQGLKRIVLNECWKNV
jgi:hypothetical protein